MIKPQIYIDTTDDIQSSIQNFIASILTALKYSSTPSDKNKHVPLDVNHLAY